MSASLQPDLLVDRRRLKRQLLVWRVLAVLLAALAAFVAFRGATSLAGRGHLVRLKVEGAITDDYRVSDTLEAAARNSAVKGLILSIDSPGGTVSGGEALHAAVARFQQRKPVVAVMRGTAASAAYMAALPAERIFARESTITGSIGVLMQSFDVSELLEAIGVQPETLTSGPLKAQPSPFQPLTPEGRAAMQSVINDLQSQFVGMVAEGRHMTVEEVRPLADGRVYTGRQALSLKLVDAIGGEPQARAWLAEARQIPANIPVRDLDPRDFSERTFGFALRGIAKSVISEWLAIDGVRAVWQP
ncbi:signal peptide peptidase SppA [Roseomonas marmotae]|uniref:Signal peptide peptidase SppA n=1 Tax=Roseomonas marmotae TaxID=2768161 RepID=A0ABS3K6D7_9PROT|nr:signal peptide peptidase SppA [Roseomonas marmotae]MBO1073017.1 signal peptide peptidase SppA [Roseomonas marmotae]QTI79336.1 signal peptide peptidase SppA [Roseomonas marmotae]